MKETADKMAAKGRGGDNVIAHLTGGEVVVPVEVLNEFPTLRKSLSNAFENMGLNPAQYVAGHGENSVNPQTGASEFFVHDKIKKGLKKLTKELGRVADNVLGLDNPAYNPYSAEQEMNRYTDQIQQAQAEYDEATGKMQAEAEAAQADFKAQAAAGRKKMLQTKASNEKKIKQAGIVADRAAQANSIAAQLLAEAKGAGAAAAEAGPDSAQQMKSRLAATSRTTPKGFGSKGAPSMQRPR
mgnify:CR=1 FL=1